MKSSIDNRVQDGFIFWYILFYFLFLNIVLTLIYSRVKQIVFPWQLDEHITCCVVKLDPLIILQKTHDPDKTDDKQNLSLYRKSLPAGRSVAS